MTNKYYKLMPNVFLAECETAHEKGSIIEVETKYGKINEHFIHNLIASKNGKYYYSITRADGFNIQERARKKAEKHDSWAESAQAKSTAYHEASNEGRDFLVMGEPIKGGHHSEKRHRALLERNWQRMERSVEFSDKADSHEQKAEYWRSKENDINLSMPESLEFFKFKLEEAGRKHQFLKDNPNERSHSYSLTYAKKEVNEMKKKHEVAVKLWG